MENIMDMLINGSVGHNKYNIFLMVLRNLARSKNRIKPNSGFFFFFFGLKLVYSKENIQCDIVKDGDNI